jgi:8-oxo-dGTP diphosphatase
LLTIQQLRHLPSLPEWPVVTVIVVGAAILDGDRLLAARRLEPPELAGGWELPGGKVDAGETEEEALVRECREELGVVIRLLERVGGDWPMGTTAVLRVWTADVVEGTPQPLEDHSELRWLEPSQWYDVEWLDADLPVVRALEEMVLRNPAS